MSRQPSGNKLPLSYSLPPPPPSSFAGKGKGRGRGKGRGSERFQPLLRQNNQPGLNQQNSQLFGSTYPNKINEQLLPNIEKNDVPHKLDIPQNLQTPSKKINKTTSLKNSNDYEKLIDNHKKLLAETRKYSPQEQFTSLLDSFSKSIFDNMQNLQRSFEEKYSILDRPTNSSSDKYKNLSFLNDNQESLNKKGKQLKVDDQSCSNFSQTKQPVGQNSKVTSSRLPNASSNQLKKQVSPDNKQGGSAQDKDYQVKFAAAAKAALAATSALQYKDQNADDKQNTAQYCKSNNQSKWSCESCAQNFVQEIQLKNHKKYCGPSTKKSNNDESRLKPVMSFNLDTPEAIAKWIEDRKKNYPTDVNITRKKELEAARIARGKILKAQAKNKRSLDSANSHKGYGIIKKMRLGNGRQINIGTNNGPYGSTDLLVAASSAGAPLDDKIIRMLQPALSTLFSSRNLIMNNKVFKTVSNSTVSVQKKNKKTGDFYSKVCIKYRQGHCPRGKDCINKHTGKMICPPLQRPPDDARCRQKNLRELLLYKEIVEEKNMILQCIRHIVNNNFFGVVTNKAIRDAKKRGEALVTEIGDQLSTDKNGQSSNIR
ncbi:hypothetical protein RclHR1_05350004 [Rhizophagus clarus]|uniref:C3H1-type domain-containing protein n=1 Tax=Rhizophagus clarus TaxID=94130 RepID=A0A2Z6S3Z4_9GLOM|nr:hypothetical protein RclHR1_05350004 [Rhizophagus clarus]